MTKLNPGSYHTATLSLKDAAAINDNVRIVVYGYVHGTPGQESFEPDICYDSARTIVDSLDPARGDVLFMEGGGYKGSFASTTGATPKDLERLREKRSITPHVYLGGLAINKGVTVLYADMHETVVEEFNCVAGVSQAQDGAMLHGWPQAPVFHSLREEQAANTVKDYAVGQLAALASRRRQGQEPPLYALAWGGEHLYGTHTLHGTSNGLGVAFGRLSLKAQMIQLPSMHPLALLDSMATRYFEYFTDIPYGAATVIGPNPE